MVGPFCSYTEFWEHSDRTVGTLALITWSLHTILAAKWRERERDGEGGRKKGEREREKFGFLRNLA